MCAVNGELFSFLVYLGLLLVSVAVLIFAIWHMKADFYEDALASAGKRAQMLEAAKEGRVIAGKAHAKSSKGRKLKGWGVIRVFTKEIYCRKRTSKIWNHNRYDAVLHAGQCRYFPFLCQDHGGVWISCAGLYFVFCTFLPEYGKSDCTGDCAKLAVSGAGESIQESFLRSACRNIPLRDGSASGTGGFGIAFA